MKNRKKWAVSCSIIALAGGLLAGCSDSNKAAPSTSPSTASPTASASPSAGQPVDGGTLTFGTFSDIITVNPIYLQDTSSGDASTFLYANLFDYDRQGNPVAEKWSLATEPMKISDDGMTYTVKLKKEAKWSDGQPVTADDVKFTFETIKNPDAGAPGASTVDKLDTITKIDDQTVEFKLKQIYAPFQYSLCSAIAPYHVLKDIPVKELQNNVYGKDPAKTVTNGPWKWKEWNQKQNLTFDADTNFWGPKPHIQKVVYKIYADQTTQTQSLIKGDTDMSAGIPVTQLEAVKKKEGIQIISDPGPQYEYMAFNFDAKNYPDSYNPFAGQKTRQAVAYAINRQGMVDNVLKGTGKLMNSPFLPGSWADPGDAAVNYTFDPAKAKALLKDDGWAPGSDGILTKDGHRFSFELQYNAGNSRRQQVSAIIQQNLKDVGIEVVPKGIDFSTWIDQNVNPGKFPVILLAWVMNSPDPDAESTFSSKFFTPAGQNNIWYKNEKLDDLWVKGYSTTAKAQRKKIYAEAAKEISTDLPYIFLYQYGTPEGLNANVHFADADKPQLSLAYGYIYHVINWWVDSTK